jgi:hypothetical protein
MSVDLVRVRRLLKEGNFRLLFVDEMGWERYDAKLTVELNGRELVLNAFAQKRGMVAYLCPTPAGLNLPQYAERRQIERQVAKSVHEHLIVFTDATRDVQVWQWVRREPGKPVACREHRFHRAQTGEALAQKLQAIAFTLEEEADITLLGVTRRLRIGFDVERVTRRFYDQFKKEHAAFLKFIKGIPESGDHEWYASVMLNRLMFVYFIQRKGFLDGDVAYLRNRLSRCQRENGRDRFYSFYRSFLLRLFHEGLGGTARNAPLDELLGRIPYLNGGLFERHEVEERYKDIQIPDKAFERIFSYFDEYQWHLDERPLRADNEINPDVLGYIFEKYINQKEMGAYYTKEDITEYISQNTVLPFVLDAARTKCKVAFENSDGPTVWDLLASAPDRYVSPVLSHGLGLAFPPWIAAGEKPPSFHDRVGDAAVKTLELRKHWNKSAPQEYALPTESWRDVVGRRERYHHIRGILEGGKIRNVNDLITLNLDTRQFAQDVIENCEGPELLRAIWHSITKVTILDPTCGSGAFLFAALNVLEPLYEACLDRMEAFLEDLDASGEKHRPEKFSDFRKVMGRVAAHPNRRYFVFKSIILNNLFGVDIMEEAVEICKLRLFLKLAAQVEPDQAHHNLGIEPLPDIDFNIKAGNTLVGFATFAEAERAITSKLDFENTMEKVAVKAADLQQAFDAFRVRQIDRDGSVPTEHKLELRHRLADLQDELNGYLGAEYGLASKGDRYAKWLKTHQPFHWFVEFYGIISGGGFDVIIGNPPYIEYAKVKTTYTIPESLYSCLACGNLYAVVIERCGGIIARGGRLGMIVQLSAICTDRMEPLQTLYRSHCSQIWASCYDDRPAKLFDGLEHIRATILLSHHVLDRSPKVYTTSLMRWYTEFREYLFPLLHYGDVSDAVVHGSFPKMGDSALAGIVDKVRSTTRTLSGVHQRRSPHSVYYYRSPLYWIRSMDFLPHFDSAAATRSVHHFKDFGLTDESVGPLVGCLINSTIFYIWFIVYGNGRNVALRDIATFPTPDSIFGALAVGTYRTLFARLMADYKKHSILRTRNDGIQFQEFYPSKSKPLLDLIDQSLARHFGFTEEQIDLIINYDIKYRMGRDAENE